MIQITEDYCSFEVAKLLKEKGFNIETIKYWENEGGPTTIPSICELSEPYSNSYLGTYEYSCPTLQMACKWLREVHGLFISLEPCFDYELKHVVYLAFIQNVADIDIFKEGRVEVASGYIVEAVYGKALKYCLEHLI